MSTLTKTDGIGRLLLRVQDGACRLPDIFITDKNDTFHMESRNYSTFRIMAMAVQRDLYGNLIPVETVSPAVSSKITVSLAVCYTRGGGDSCRVLAGMQRQGSRGEGVEAKRSLLISDRYLTPLVIRSRPRGR